MTAPAAIDEARASNASIVRRVRAVVIACVLISILLLPSWNSQYWVLISRLLVIGGVALAFFALFERWPKRLPRWAARWVLQVMGVTAAIPIGAFTAYLLIKGTSTGPFWLDKERLQGFAMLMVMGLLFAPWMAVSALVRQINGEAQRQALAFELERSELERQALDARLNLLQAQVEPHFLFNTLANVRELVDAGSPQASTVLASLIAYLRAAVPRLHEGSTTVAQELELVRAYLDVMHMRMPDRLQFSVSADEHANAWFCPAMAILTLVENAVRHGIDPSEEGGRIDVHVESRDGRCRATVIDTGVGLRPGRDGLGTGLSTLRERLLLTFAGDAQLVVAPNIPRGVRAEIAFPARAVAP
jgi:hypothetical protein